MEEVAEIQIATKDKIAPYEELTPEKRQQDWLEVEELVLKYQKQFQDENIGNKEIVEEGKVAAEELLRRFCPLFKKYLVIIKSGTFNWEDKESKEFVSNFISDRVLLRALHRKKQTAEYRRAIYESFNFIKESYGHNEDAEIMTDLQMLFLVIAKRYKQVGKNFCAYVNNGYKFEVARHIKKIFANPLNVPYKICEYNADTFKGKAEEMYEDQYYENETGVPSYEWINGYCGEAFQALNPLERKILVKYYLENLNDKQIANDLGLHLNTINAKRRRAVMTLCDELGVDFTTLKRNRKSGKKAIVSTV